MTEMLHIIFIVSLHKKSAPVFTFCLLVFLRSQLSLLHMEPTCCAAQVFVLDCMRVSVCAKCR